jgi:DNA-binding SARP family transcriptional activator
MCSDGHGRLRSYALGRFLVLKHDQPLRFARRPQHRPLQLLQAIITGAGTGARISDLVAALWPESDGDAAHTAFGVALHRLRKLLGSDDSLLVSEGRVHLNPDICWVDALAFDVQTTAALASSEASRLMLQSMERLVHLYSGHFLGSDVESPWAIRFRDRLRAKFQRLVLTLGAALESEQLWTRAAETYQRALEVDNLQEDIYRRLMICLREQGERAGAMNVYRRCRDLLSIVLGVVPSPETEAIARSLRP